MDNKVEIRVGQYYALATQERKLMSCWIDRKNQEQEKQKKLLLDRNILMSKFLECDPTAISAIRNSDKEKLTKNFIKDRESSINVLKWLAKNASCALKRMASKKQLKVEVFRLENARQIVQADCKVYHV